MVDPSPTSSTPSCLILLGSALQEKALKTLEKAKAKAMEKVPWKRLIFRDFRDLPWTKEFLDLPRISFCSSCWISFQRFPRDDPRLRNAWGKRPWKWVSHHWSLWKCHGVAWEDAAGGLLGSKKPDRPSVYPYSAGRGWDFWKGFTVEGV